MHFNFKKLEVGIWISLFIFLKLVGTSAVQETPTSSRVNSRKRKHNSGVKEDFTQLQQYALKMDIYVSKYLVLSKILAILNYSKLCLL